ncbi:MAG: branched-chain amino acid ABC transporter permease [Reyranella sp.]|uniref:branched-chain amino acid ABC transporter permease n=1 Tax=Reyranella sp. TaxID=1929291 RepID=UPI0025F10841|nr:branched-chain amino acid ABC transporter permease [Reyranella sp.]MBR2816087.1 branched-chain amino acid ABC transporter permease [Reyranella sp.]
MIYREAGQYKVSYEADQAIFPIAQDRFLILALLAVAFFVVPFVATEYLYRAVLIPTVILALAAIGLNVLMGYCGQVSLGSGAFMAVGAYAAYNLSIRLPFLNPFVCILLGGFFAAAVGVVFGAPSLRIKGFYLACATLAAQFFIDWVFLRVKYFTNYAPSGSVNAPPLQMFGYDLSSPVANYMVALGFTVVLALAVKNIVRGHIGRQWMAIRDMDIAAEIIGVRPMYAKLSAFAVSSFLIGVAGGLWAFIYLGSWEPAAFSIDRSFQLMFMVIIGGLGSILGSFLGAAFIILLPIFLNQALPPIGGLVGWKISTATVSHFEAMAFGALIVFFLVVEPHGLARLWSIAKEKLRLWPFPH